MSCHAISLFLSDKQKTYGGGVLEDAREAMRQIGPLGDQLTCAPLGKNRAYWTDKHSSSRQCQALRIAQDLQ